MRSDVAVTVLVFCGSIAGCGASPQAGPVAPNAPPTAPLENGLYFVKSETPVVSATPPPAGPSERVLRYDPTKFDSLSREVARFVKVSTDEPEPLVREEPQVEGTEDGKQIVFLPIDEGAGKVLEFFARKREGGKVAIVVGNEILGVHKTRELVRQGHLRIARCTERGCKELEAKLRAR